MQIVTLYEREEPKEQFLTPELRQLYGGDLSFPAPHSNRFLSSVGVPANTDPGICQSQLIDGDQSFIGAN